MSHCEDIRFPITYIFWSLHALVLANLFKNQAFEPINSINNKCFIFAVLLDDHIHIKPHLIKAFR